MLGLLLWAIYSIVYTYKASYYQYAVCCWLSHWVIYRRFHISVKIYSTAYTRMCATRLNIVVWRLHHVFNIWTGISYVCAYIRQIVGHVHLWTLHSFWMNFLMKLIILIVYAWWTYVNCLCLFQSILESIILLKKLFACSMSHALLFGQVWRMDSSLVIESLLTSLSLSSQLVGR